jgi:molybdopterin biosynthesis enzyme MoaB
MVQFSFCARHEVLGNVNRRIPGFYGKLRMACYWPVGAVQSRAMVGFAAIMILCLAGRVVGGVIV